MEEDNNNNTQSQDDDSVYSSSSGDSASEPTPTLPGIAVSRYCLNVEQYSKLIHLQKNHPGYSRVETLFDEFSPKTVRISLQMGAQLFAILSACGVAVSLISAPNRFNSKVLISIKQNARRNSQIAASLTVLISSSRFLRRFLDAIRSNVLKVSAPHVRKHYPYLYALLTSKKVSAGISAAAAGYAAACVLPAQPDELRVSLAIYLATRYAEMVYNYLEDEGYTDYLPDWAGSYLLLPLATQELFYNFIFHPSATPRMFRRLVMSFSQGYIQPRPANYPQSLPWPNPDEIVESVAEIAQSQYNRFTSPMLKPGNGGNELIVPRQFTNIAPLVSLAHPGITKLSGAILHPFEKSDFRNVLEYVIRQSGRIGKFMGAIYLVIGLLSKRKSLSGIFGIFGQITKYTALLTLYLTTLWGGTDIVYDIIPSQQILPLFRFRIIGFIAGLWSLLDYGKPTRKGYLMQSIRLAILSRFKLYKRSTKGKNGLISSFLIQPKGQITLISASLAGIMILMEAHPQAIAGSSLRKCLNFLRGKHFVDPLRLRNSPPVKKSSTDQQEQEQNDM